MGRTVNLIGFIYFTHDVPLGDSPSKSTAKEGSIELRVIATIHLEARWNGLLHNSSEQAELEA
jgi:hypothetical protein